MERYGSCELGGSARGELLGVVEPLVGRLEVTVESIIEMLARME